MRKAAYVVTAMLLLAACSRTDNEPGPGGVTVSEAEALDDAAEMLESRDGGIAAGNAGATDRAAAEGRSE